MRNVPIPNISTQIYIRTFTHTYTHVYPHPLFFSISPQALRALEDAKAGVGKALPKKDASGEKAGGNGAAGGGVDADNDTSMQARKGSGTKWKGNWDNVPIQLVEGGGVAGGRHVRAQQCNSWQW